MNKLLKAFTLVMAVAQLSACAAKNPDNPNTTDNSNTATENSAATQSSTAPEKGETYVGYSTYTYVSSSKEAEGENGGNVDVQSYIGMALVGEDGKVKQAKIDAVQSKIPFDSKGQLTGDIAANPSTKTELGENYGMRQASAISKEWFEQAQALSDWAVGKTLEEISQTPITDGKFADADLVSSVTVKAKPMHEALSKTNVMQLVGKPAEQDRIGLGVYTSIGKSTSAGEKEGNAQSDTTIAFIAIDEDEKITACAIDALQTKVGITAEGKISSDLNAITKTKAQLGTDYGMKSASPIGKEWNEQAAAFAEWCVGKTLDEIVGLKTKAVDENHPEVPDIAELNSSVTISVGDYIIAITKAFKSAES